MDISIILYLLFATGCHLIQFASSQSIVAQCQKQKESTVEYSLTSKQNATGHLIHKVTLGYAKNNAQQPWLIKMVENTAICDGVEFVTTTTTLTSNVIWTHEQITLPQVALPQNITGYDYFPGSGYYKYHSEEKSWNDARMTCASLGGHLAIINSEKESATLLKTMWNIDNSVSTVWIGFHDPTATKKFVTITGEPIETTGFTRWYPRSRMPGSNNCGTIHQPSGGLNDYKCSDVYPFICERAPDGEIFF